MHIEVSSVYLVRLFEVSQAEREGGGGGEIFGRNWRYRINKLLAVCPA